MTALLEYLIGQANSSQAKGSLETPGNPPLCIPVRSLYVIRIIQFEIHEHLIINQSFNFDLRMPAYHSFFMAKDLIISGMWQRA